ncbi:MAG TPA: glycosyltransferase family 39 protein [Chloroflexota bacterium]
MSRRALAAFLLVNLLLVGVYVWALDDPLVIRIDLDGGRVQAQVEGSTIAAVGLAPESTTLGLYLEGPPSGARAASLPWPLPDVVNAFLALDADQAWRSVRLLDEGGQPGWSHDFRADGDAAWTDPRGVWFRDLLGDATTGTGGFIASPPTGWQRGQLLATLQRGRAGAGIVIGGNGAGDGLFLLVRPVHRDLLLWQLRDGVWYGPLAGGPYLRPWHSALKDLMRLLLKPYLAALLLGSATLLIGSLARLGWRRSAERLPELPTDVPRSPAALGVVAARPRSWLGAAELPLAISLAVATTAFAAVIADSLLERMPHVQDSVAYLFQAKIFATGRLWADLPPMPEFFEHEFVVMRDGRWFGKYPPGFPALLSLGVLAGVPWLVSPLLAGLTSLATYALGARAAGRPVGLLAALLLLFSPFYLFLSGEFMAHTAGLALAMFFALAYLHADRGSRSGAILAGLALGGGALVRPWTALLLAAPFGLDLLLRLHRQPRSTLRLAALMAVGLAPPLAAYVGWNWVMAGGPFANTMELWWPTDKLGFGPDKGLTGHTPLNGLYNSLRNLSELSSHAFGWPGVFTFLFALVPFATARAGRWDRIWLASWLALMVGYFFWWADGVMYGPRFYFEAIGFMALLSARGLAVLAELGGRAGRVLAAALLGALLLFCAYLYLPVQLPLLRGYNYVSRVSLDAVERAGIHHAVVFVDTGGVYEWWNYGMVFSANSPRLDTDVIYARDLGPGDARLMQLYPDRHFYRLRRTVLEKIEADNGR